MIHPTIHLNGTSRDRLAEQINTARKALTAALDAFAKERLRVAVARRVLTLVPSPYGWDDAPVVN